jgi:HTH-type transcriptional regulator/antitoxin HipB
MNENEFKTMSAASMSKTVSGNTYANGTVEDIVISNGYDPHVLGKKLQEIRNNADLIQDEVAEKMGTRKSYVSRVENGLIDLRLSSLFKVAQSLGKELHIVLK